MQNTPIENTCPIISLWLIILPAATQPMVFECDFIQCTLHRISPSILVSKLRRDRFAWYDVAVFHWFVQRGLWYYWPEWRANGLYITIGPVFLRKGCHCSSSFDLSRSFLCFTASFSSFSLSRFVLSLRLGFSQISS